jgi:hypothetical protein
MKDYQDCGKLACAGGTQTVCRNYVDDFTTWSHMRVICAPPENQYFLVTGEIQEAKMLMKFEINFLKQN